MKKFVLSAALPLLIATPALAQLTIAPAQPLAQAQQLQTPPTIPANVPFTVEFDHDGVNTTGYRLYVDGVKMGTDYGMGNRNPSTGVVRLVSATGVAPGAHYVEVSAFGLGGETKSPRLDFNASAPPTAPSLPRFVLTVSQQADGTWKLEFQQAN